MSKTLKFLVSLLVCFLAAGLGSFFTTPAIRSWYAFLLKPSFSPPNWLFGPVWTLLYFLMATSFYLVWNKAKKKEFAVATKIFTAQLTLNVLWSILFFGLHNPGLAFLDIVLLWLAIAMMIIKFEKIDKTAAYLQIPYLLWVSFASILNFAVWRLN